MTDHVFTEITLLIAVATGVALIMRALKQPLIIGHILTGLIVGPSILGLVQSPETVGLMGEFGIALLLFIVGLGLNPKIIKEVGKVSLLTGLGQVTFTASFALLLTNALGYGGIESLYIAVALSFSSTIIILKLLNDKKEQNKLYGKISIGFLLVQDVVATLALVVASATSHGGLSLEDLGWLAVKGLLLGLAIFLVARFILKPMTNFLSRSQEMLFLFAIAWGFGVGTLFYELGFSLEVGALIAGIALANLPYAAEVGSRLKPLRDFFLIVFFIALGSRLNLDNFQSYIAPAMAMSSLVLIGNPIIVMTIMGLLGYTKRNSFKAGLTVAQISEFSLIFLLLGQRGGQIDESIVTVITLVALITIAVSTYMITYADGLYNKFERYLTLFERRKVKNNHETKHVYDVVMFGYKKGGSEFIRVLPTITKRFIVVDYDPEVIDNLSHKNTPYLYGDVTDPELLEELDLTKTKLVISLVSDHATNIFLLRYLEQHNPNSVVICHADSTGEAAELYGLGASYVMMPTYIGSEKISSFIKRNGFNKTEFKHHREKHIQYLQKHYEAPPVDV
ncbi:MAG: cation:proton antiporter [Candidatus Saccharibacteria bacterium]|nr:cation:proton antiporter [Candidatus Saccharibacteria bacterium]